MDLQPEADAELAPRLTLRSLLRGFFTRFLSLEHGWLRTARELTVAPGTMIRRYVEGHRKDYANPFAYLVAATFVSFVAQTLVDFRGRMVEGMQLTAGESPAQVAFINAATELLFGNMIWVSILIFIPLALLLRLFFLRSQRNLAEVSVFAIYSGGHLAVLGAVLVAGTLLIQPGGLVHSIGGIIFAIAYTSWASQGFFQGRLPLRVIKIAGAWVIAYGFLIVLVAVGTIVFMVAAGHFTGEDWNLVSATEQELVPVVTALLQEGADPDMVRQRTALHVAAENGNEEIVDLLINNGADLNARDHLGRVPLFIAVAAKRTEIARTLREAGTDAAVTTNRGSSLLLVAVSREDRDTAAWALDNGVDINAVRAEGTHVTALMVAAGKNDLEMVDLLLTRGADPTITNPEGKTALGIANKDEVKARLRAAPGRSSELPKGGR